MPKLEKFEDDTLRLDHLFAQTHNRGRTVVKIDPETREVIVGYQPLYNVGDPAPPVSYYRVAR